MPALIALLLFAQLASAAYEPPLNDGFITDQVAVLTTTQEQQLEEVLEEYTKNTSNEIAILVIDSFNEYADADIAVEVIRTWGIGQKDKDNGVLILHAYNDRKIYIGVGYGLEGVLPDIVLDGIIREQMIEPFRGGDYFLGYTQAIDSLQKHIGGEYTADKYTNNQADMPFLLFSLLAILQVVVPFLRLAKGWWLGGVIGLIIGIISTWLYSFWLAIPIFFILGLCIDYIISNAKFTGGYGNRSSGYGYSRPSRSRSSGGFRGFGGGRSGGGGSGPFLLRYNIGNLLQIH